MPPLKVAYYKDELVVILNHKITGEGYYSGQMKNKLYPPEQSFIGISLDNPELVASHMCRHDACVTIPENFEKEQHQDVQFKSVDGGLYALYQFYDEPHKIKCSISIHVRRVATK